MTNKTALKKDGTSKSKLTEKSQKRPVKKSTGIVASSVGSSAVDAVKARSSKDVRGGSGLANTGTIISYD
ncbi:hypothetical protein BH11BAC5_BH11BAC5_50750 [soil metagenome]|jgi:hypothetical protein